MRRIVQVPPESIKVLPLASLMERFENWLLLGWAGLKRNQGSNYMAKKRKAKKTNIKRKRTAKLKKKWSTPKLKKRLPPKDIALLKKSERAV
jgi:hypothetical protein